MAEDGLGVAAATLEGGEDGRGAPDPCVISPPSTYIPRKPYFPAIALPSPFIDLICISPRLVFTTQPPLTRRTHSLAAVAHSEQPSRCDTRAGAWTRGIGERVGEGGQGLDRGGLYSTPPASIQGHPGTLPSRSRSLSDPSLVLLLLLLPSVHRPLAAIIARVVPHKFQVEQRLLDSPRTQRPHWRSARRSVPPA